MTDLTQRFHSHGSTGTKPPNGLDKEGGDQYEAEYFDYMSDSLYKDTVEKNEAITRRVEHLSGDRVLSGLDISHNSGRTIAVSASDGAYVNGQFTGPIDSWSLTLSSNTSSSNRTDSIYVDSSGNVSTKSGTTTVPSSTYKLAEVTVSPNNTVVGVSDFGLQRTKHGTSEDRPSGVIGDTLYHESGSPTGREGKGTYEVHDGQQWRELLFADGRQERTDHQWYGGNNIYNVGNLYFDDGDTSLDDVFVNESGDTMTGPLKMSSSEILQLPDPNRDDEPVPRGYADDRYVNEGGDTMTGPLNMSDNTVSGLEFLKFYPDSAQYIDIDTSAGTYGIRDANDTLPYTYRDEHRFRESQVRFEGGSVYWGQTEGDGNNNDSYDAVWENKPSGKDFRIHLKQDPEDSSLSGTFGMLFSTDNSGPKLAIDVDTDITYVSEIRADHDNRSGTPIANGYLGNAANIGEIWYDPGPGEFRGKRAGGEIVQLGEPV